MARAGTLFNVFWFTAMQSDVPSAELSRVSSWDYLGSLAMQPVGQLVAGPVAVRSASPAPCTWPPDWRWSCSPGVLAVPAVRNFSPASSRRADSARAV